MSNISLPEDFNINKSNFKNNYIKYYDENGFIIDPIINNYNSNEQKNDIVLQKLDKYLLNPAESTDITKEENGFNNLKFEDEQGNEITTDTNPVNYNLKVKSVENVIKNIKESIGESRVISPLQSVYSILIIVFTILCIMRLLKLDFIDGIFGKVIENKSLGIDNVFKRLFLIFYIFILLNTIYIFITMNNSYSDYLASIGSIKKDNDLLFVLIGFLLSFAIFLPTYIWSFMATNRFTRNVIVLTILAVHLLLIDWMSIPDVKKFFNQDDTNESYSNIFSQIILFVFILFIIIYALYFKFHNKEIFASGYKNKIMYFLFFFLLATISGYSGLVKLSMCNNKDQLDSYFCNLLKRGKISLISIGSLIAIACCILIYYIYKYFFRKGLPDIEADSINYFFVKYK